jgi:hypothetical protein
MDASELLHAYAVLGLSPPVTVARLKRRYKSLVKRWHPDRFQSDPVGQVEANQRLRDINIAYDVIAAALADNKPSESAQSHAAQEPMSPPIRQASDPWTRPISLSPQESDAWVDAINRMSNWSPVEEPDWNRTISGLIALLWIGFIAINKGPAGVVAWTLAILLPLAFVWFPDEVEGVTMRLPGVSRPLLPAWFVRLVGWVSLLALAGISGMIIGTPHL